jgi:hypothetical protein
MAAIPTSRAAQRAAAGISSGTAEPTGGLDGDIYFKILAYRLLRGGGWQMFGAAYVQYDQDVRFSIFDSGLGFPTYHFVQHIIRSSVPAAPTMLQAYGISESYIHVVFAGNHDGGSAILEWQIGYGRNANAPEAYWASFGTSDVGPFSSGQRVFVWARARNALGWSSWSNRMDTITWRVPDSPNPIEFSFVTQNSMQTLFVDRGWGGTDVTERQLGYGRHPTIPEVLAFVDTYGINILTGLDPGKTYYAWGRVRNSVGWSPWSERRQVDLIAGAQVMVEGIWKRAVPYVKVEGTWKVARPWTRVDGVWKESSR